MVTFSHTPSLPSDVCMTVCPSRTPPPQGCFQIEPNVNKAEISISVLAGIPYLVSDDSLPSSREISRGQLLVIRLVRFTLRNGGTTS